MSSTELPPKPALDAVDVPDPSSPIASLRQRYLNGETTPLAELDATLTRSNSNINHNVYVGQDAAWSRRQAGNLRAEDLAGPGGQPLWGIPVSLKDCFDLASFPTSCGSRFYSEHNGLAATDSSLAAALRSAGAVITGKTHLHQLAYGITGENPDFADCLQPRDPSRLTGGSSSGAAASVQEGSALAAIGTDTGGSIRAPAALCGLAGYRSSISLNTGGLWRGGAHLASSFDTIGWLYRDLRDGPLLARALFDLAAATSPDFAALRIGVPGADFLHDCEPGVLSTLQSWQSLLEQNGATLTTFDAGNWNDALSIFAPIQAYEAAQIHRGYFGNFEMTIAERLAWGESISASEIASLHIRLTGFRGGMDHLFDRFDYLLLPCAPISALLARQDHSATRARILRYTAPASLAGLPVVALPGDHGGLQLVGRLNHDADLLALSAALGDHVSSAALVDAPIALRP